MKFTCQYPPSEGSGAICVERAPCEVFTGGTLVDPELLQGPNWKNSEPILQTAYNKTYIYTTFIHHHIHSVPPLEFPLKNGTR